MRPLPEPFIAFKTAEPVSISAQLYRHLRAAIVRGEIQPGVALSEAELSKQYAISRQPVREAFIKLAEERLVSIQPQRGTFVVKISMKEVLDARFVREAIEVAVALEAANMTPPGLIQELRSQLAQQSALAPGDHADFLALDEEFHRTIALSVGHAHAWRVVESIKAQMDRVRYLSFDEATPIASIIAQHNRIVDALEAGDPIATAAAMRTHLREIMSSLPRIAAMLPEYFETE